MTAAKKKPSAKKPPPSRNDQIVRVLAILRELDRLGGIDLYELAERHGTTVRTIRRDFDALQQVGIPLEEEPGTGARKRWRLASRGHIEKLSRLLDVSHFLALKMAMGQGNAVRGASSVFAALEDLSDKIETVLGDKGREELAAIEACFHSYEKFAYRSSAPDVFWPLIKAIREQRLCQVKYRPPRAKPNGKDSNFQVLPLRLFVHNGAVYVMVHVPYFGNYALLNLQRLQSLKVLEETGSPPADFNPSALEDTAFGIYMGAKSVKYRLQFTADVAPYIRERVWHPSQTLTDLDGGGVELSFECGESYEVSSWVASWRQNVVVLEPAALREELAAIGRAWAGQYGSGADPEAGAVGR